MTVGPASDLHPELAAEPHVTLDHVPHVLDPVAEHQRPLQTHAEGETGVPIGVDAVGLQNPRVHHAAAAPLDPALTATGPARAVRVADGRAAADEALQVDLGRRLGEGEEV